VALDTLGDLWAMLRSIAAPIAILVASLVLAFIASKYTRSIVASRISVAAAAPASRAVFISILFVGIVVALARVGVDLSSVLVAGGLLAIAVGFAAQTTISSFLSGILLYVDRPFRVGDTVTIGNHSGVVEDISIFSVRLRTFDGRYVRIPNEEAFRSTLVNLATSKARRIEYQVLLPVDADIGRAVNTVRRVLQEHPLVLAEPEPAVFVSQATVDGIVLNIWAWVPSRAFFQVWTELLGRIREELVKDGIQLAIPQRVFRIKAE